MSLLTPSQLQYQLSIAPCSDFMDMLQYVINCCIIIIIFIPCSTNAGGLKSKNFSGDQKGPLDSNRTVMLDCP